MATEMATETTPSKVTSAQLPKLTCADERKRFVIELFTGFTVEHWLATNAALKALTTSTN